MKNKLKFLIGVSLRRKVQTKWFYIANICIALVIIGLANIDHIINFFGGDFDQKTKIYVIDNTDVAFDIFKASADASFSLTDDSENNYEIINSDNFKEEIIEMIKTNEAIKLTLLHPLSIGHIDIDLNQILLNLPSFHLSR